MPNRRFEKVVDDYLANTAPPGDLVWLRTEISLSDQNRKIFLKKCRQHQATQYFMVQRDLPSDWGGLSEEDLLGEPEAGRVEPEQSLPEPVPVRKSKPRPVRRLGSVFEFAAISGLACVTVVTGLAWLDRDRLFQEELPKLGGQEQSPLQPVYAADAVHLKIAHGSSEPGQALDTRQRYLSAQQFYWYLRLGETVQQGKWADLPTDYGIDFEQLDRLHQRSLYRAADFPHSLLDPDFMFEPVKTDASSQDG